MTQLLVVDDEPSILQLFRRTFEKLGVEAFTAATAKEAVHLANEHAFDAAVFDVLLPDKSGLELFQEIQAIDPKLPVIFITSGGTSDTAIDAMKLGAFDYLMKPLDLKQVRELVGRAFDVRRMMSQPVAIGESAPVTPTNVDGSLARSDALIGRSSAMQEVYKSIGRVAGRKVTVLVRGESGTGKELVARAIYQHSKRADGPFLAVNCAAIPEALLESELFGHEKGAFTGADRRRIGKFEQCNGGTIFLDEIGDMTLVLQSKMLRLLQDQRFERVGGNETIQTDVRIITATHRNLEEMVDESRFRADLYFRLNVFSVELPPLRDRLDDLPSLVHHFLQLANEELEQDVESVSPETLDLLRGYAWPGNIRELQSVLKQAVLNTSGSVLLPVFLPDAVREISNTVSARAVNEITKSSEQTESPSESEIESPATTNDWDRFIDEQLLVGTESLYDNLLARMECHLLTRVLSHTEGNQAAAAKILGITRATIRNKIKQHGIKIGRRIESTAAKTT